MIRTQIYIPEDLHRELKFIARQEKKKLSELIREGARRVIAEKERGKSNTLWLKNITGIVRRGPKDLSQKVDHYLYVAPYKRVRARKSKHE